MPKIILTFMGLNKRRHRLINVQKFCRTNIENNFSSRVIYLLISTAVSKSSKLEFKESINAKLYIGSLNRTNYFFLSTRIKICLRDLSYHVKVVFVPTKVVLMINKL